MKVNGLQTYQHNLFSLESPGIRMGGLSLFQLMLIPADPMTSGGGTGRMPRRGQVVMGTSLICCAIVFSLLIGDILPAQSVIMPPHKSLFETDHRNSSTSSHMRALSSLADKEEYPLNKPEDTPYFLTISQDDVSVNINGESNITVNLNRAVPVNISVLVSVNSGPNLITFDTTRSSQSNSKSLLPGSDKYTEHIITYEANTFGDRVVKFKTNDKAGHAEIVCHVVKQPSVNNITIDDSQAFISINIYRNWNLIVIIQIVGWIYFFAWSTSFYFQVNLNYQRKSVVGLNFDFLILNLLGFTCYSIYNISLLYSHTIQQEYYHRYTYSRIPVEYNDLFFAMHAFAITLITVIQCFIYERADQQISLPAGIFVSLTSAVGFILFITAISFHSLTILDVVLYLSYVKLAITIIKYSPQAYMNYKRKATTGWSIHNIMLDFTGGSFSILQMLLIAYNYDDWISIFGNATKFGLGLFSMGFDIVFFIQHYVLYRNSSSQQLGLVSNENDLENSSDSVPSPIISQSIRSANQMTSQTAANQANGGNGDAETNGESGGETTD